MDLENLKGLDKLASAKVRVPETSLRAGTAGVQGTVAQSVSFCELWPAAKAVLEVLGKKVPALAFVVGILISVGDSVCPG